MALTKSSNADKIEVVTVQDADGNDVTVIQVRTMITVSEDGQVISTTPHRHVIKSGDDWTSEPSNVQTVCNAVFA